MLDPATMFDDEELVGENVRDRLLNRILILNDRAWENRLKQDKIDRWLKNFNGKSGTTEEIEHLHALFTLAQFMFFGSKEIRVLLNALYRDLFLCPLIQEIRSNAGNTRNLDAIRNGVIEALKTTRFLGVGNPSESGVHLLYYFRQENGLPKDLFLDAADIFEWDFSGGSKGRTTLKHPDVTRYIFLDDLCGSGETAEKYSNGFLKEMLVLQPKVEFSYFSLFATKDGIDYIDSRTLFKGNVRTVFELGQTYKFLSAESRYAKELPDGLDFNVVRKMQKTYGEILWPTDPYGYKDGQLLLGLHHNTPDNTLPTIWMDGSFNKEWVSIFKRYPKIEW
jgi:hypothetical protein